MTTFRTGVEFGTNIGVLERDYQRGMAASQSWGQRAQRDLTEVTAAHDKLALAAQRVAAAETQLASAEERLRTVQASGTATIRERAAAQASFVASQERLLRAQSEQARLLSAPAQAPRGMFGGNLGLFTGLAATEGAIKIKDAIEEGARVAAQAQAIGRQIDVTLASTGNVADTSAGHIHHVSEEVARLTGILPNTIDAGQLLELTFTGIRNEGAGQKAIFDRTAESAANMAVGIHLARGSAIDYQGSMQLLARALNDPIQGMTMLRRAGVAFTATQRDQIKGLAESGHLLQAQSLILDLVNQKFGDAAKTFGQGAEGGLARWHVAVEELEKTLAGPMLHVGVPALHAISTAVQFMTDHPMTVWATEGVVALTGLAFSVAALEHAMRFLRESEWLAAIGKWLFGYRSMSRAIVTLEGEESAHAAAASRAAEAENLHAAAMERSTVAATELTAAQGRLAGAQTLQDMAALRATIGARSLLARTTTAVGGAGTAIALGDLIAEYLGPKLHSGGITTSFHLGQASSLIDELHGLTGTRGGGMSDRFYNAPQAAQQRIAEIYNAEIGDVLKAADNGRGNLDPLRRLITQIKDAYAAYSNNANAYEATWGRVRMGQRELTEIYAQQRDAIAAADLADANAATRREQRLNHEAAQARQLQRDVVSGQAKAITTIEQMIGVSQAGLFDQVDPSAASAQRTAAASLSSSQRSATSSQRSVVLAEARLSSLRASGKATALQLQSAETSLANARDRAAGASDRLTAAEQRSHDAQSSSLSLADVLKRATAQTQNQQALAEASRRYVQLGVHEPVMQELLALDQQAPGTFARVAAHLTRAGAAELNHDEHLKNAARHALEEAFARGNTKDAEDRAAHAATLAAQAWQQAYLAAIRNPKFWDMVNTDLGKLLLGNQGVLPKGNPGAGGTGGRGKAPSLTQQLYGVDITRTPTAAQQTQVVVHVHTSAPSYSTRQEWNVKVAAANPDQFAAWADQQAKVRSQTP